MNLQKVGIPRKEVCCMTIPSKDLLIGYDYDAWYGYSKKIPVTVDASTKNNSQTLICGMSGSGKSYLTNQSFARICLHGGGDSVVFFADFKQDDCFSHLCYPAPLVLQIILISVKLNEGTDSDILMFFTAECLNRYLLVLSYQSYKNSGSILKFV